MVEQSIKQATAPRDCRLGHHQAAASGKHALGLLQEQERKLNVVQHVDHDNIGDRSGRKRKLLRIGHQIEPGRTLDIGGDDVGKARLELANSTPDFERRPANAGRCDAIVNVTVDPAQKRLLIPRHSIAI